MTICTGCGGTYPACYCAEESAPEIDAELDKQRAADKRLAMHAAELDAKKRADEKERNRRRSALNRMAGNIAAGLVVNRQREDHSTKEIAARSVELAAEIMEIVNSVLDDEMPPLRIVGSVDDQSIRDHVTDCAKCGDCGWWNGTESDERGDSASRPNCDSCGGVGRMFIEDSPPGYFTGRCLDCGFVKVLKK